MEWSRQTTVIRDILTEKNIASLQKNIGSTFLVDRFSCVANFRCEKSGQGKNVCNHLGMRI